MPPKPSSPTRHRRIPSPAPPSPFLRLLASLVSLLPFLFPSTPTHLLYPLFSAAPTTAPERTAKVYVPLLALFIASRIFIARRSGEKSNSPPWSWRTCWIALGAHKIISEGTVRLAGESLLGLGLDSGNLVGRVLLEAVPAWVVWSWLYQSLWCKERKAFLQLWFLPVLYAFSLVPQVTQFLDSLTPLLPECYILQAHGLVLAAVAIFAPSFPPPQQAHARPPRSSRSSSPGAASTPPFFAASLRARTLTFLSLVALSHLTALTSTHCPTSLSSRSSPWLSLNYPHPSSSRILASRKSLTGWITVGEHGALSPDGPIGFRYLRADHSLLGGLWVGPSRERLEEGRRRKGGVGEVGEGEVVRRAESIYSTFILQELVRLVKAPPDLPRQKVEQGLIIGLGAGLSARALATHKVNLTIVEIDPVVYEFAREYFAVDEPTGGVVLEDAVDWVEKQKGSGKLYDYIIHDVFTGGAVPSSLFTVEFLSSLAALLHPSGALALNFAGSLTSRSSRYIISTVLASLPHCRAFEDRPTTFREEDDDKSEGDDGFKNLVVFCSASWFNPVEFREPSEADYLPDGPSPGIRKRVFGRFKGDEVDLSRFRFDGGGGGVGGAGGEETGAWEEDWASRECRKREKERWMFKKGMEAKIEGEQRAEVEAHYEVMKEVLPDGVWARW